MTNTSILQNLPNNKENKKRKLTLITVILLIVIWFVLILVGIAYSDNKQDTDSKQIAEYEYQMNELRKQKEQCYDNLTRKETQEYLSWFTKPCVEWDEVIMEMRAKADELKAKSYDMGLTLNR